jgi:hypothetical protein
MMSDYQYHEFLAIDGPLDEQQQAEVCELSDGARITATSFVSEHDWGGDPRKMMERYYDAHVYVANGGVHQVMLRLPRAFLSLETAGQYCIDPHVSAWASGKNLILDLTSQDDSADGTGGAEDWLPAMVGVRAELAAGDLRPLYLAWLAAWGTWERDEDAFDYAEEDESEPPVPAGLQTLTAPQRALADFLSLDTDLLAVAAQASPPLSTAKDELDELARWIKDLPASDKDRLLHQVAQGHGAQVQIELQRQFRGEPEPAAGGCPRRTVAELLDAAAEARQER